MQSYPAKHARAHEEGTQKFHEKRQSAQEALGLNMNASKCQMRVERDRNKQINIKNEKRKGKNESKKTDSALQQMEVCVIAFRHERGKGDATLSHATPKTLPSDMKSHM
jgi:hypothetical protein